MVRQLTHDDDEEESDGQKDSRLPSWLHQSISIVMGASVIYLSGSYVNNLASDARRAEQAIQRDLRITHLELDLSEFRKPGGRYTTQDGVRDRSEVKELQQEFYHFRDGGSRAQPIITQLVKRLDECCLSVDENLGRLHKCETNHERVQAELQFLRQTMNHINTEHPPNVGSN